MCAGSDRSDDLDARRLQLIDICFFEFDAQVLQHERIPAELKMHAAFNKGRNTHAGNTDERNLELGEWNNFFIVIESVAEGFNFLHLDLAADQHVPFGCEPDANGAVYPGINIDSYFAISKRVHLALFRCFPQRFPFIIHLFVGNADFNRSVELAFFVDDLCADFEYAILPGDGQFEAFESRHFGQIRFGLSGNAQFHVLSRFGSNGGADFPALDAGQFLQFDFTRKREIAVIADRESELYGINARYSQLCISIAGERSSVVTYFNRSAVYSFYCAFIN